MTSRRLRLDYPLLAVLFAGAFIRLYALDSAELWSDEAFSWRLSTWDASKILDRTRLDVHPPGYYLILSYWVGLVGDSRSALRLPSVLFGVGEILLMWLVTTELVRRPDSASPRTPKQVWAAWIAAALTAVHPLHVQQGRTARMYTIAAVLVLACELVALRLDARSTDEARRREWPSWVCLGLLGACSAYVHYFAGLSAGIVLAWSLARSLFRARSSRSLMPLTGPILASFSMIAALGPWLSVILFQTRSVVASFWIRPPTFGTIVRGINEYVLGLDEASAWLAGLSILATSLALLAPVFRLDRRLMLASSMAIVPIALVLAFSAATNRPLSIERVYLFSHLGFIQAVAASSITLSWRHLGAVLQCLIAWNSLFALSNQEFWAARTTRRAAEVVRYIQERRTSGLPPVVLHAHAGMLLIVEYEAKRAGINLSQRASGEPLRRDVASHYVHGAALDDDQWVHEADWEALRGHDIWKLSIGKSFMEAKAGWGSVERKRFGSPPGEWLLTRHRYEP